MEKRGPYACFISDVHLGLKVCDPSERERKLVSVLESLPQETELLYLLGDIFDFWYEYKYVVPKGFTRTLGALARLSDRGVKIYFFKGNHDIWAFGYFKDELGIEILTQPHFAKIGDKVFCIGHGDGLDKSDKLYLMLRSVFHSKFLQRAFSNIHPRWAFGLAHRWSRHNRLYRGKLYKFRDKDEPLYRYACETEKTSPADYFIFGHVHTPGNNVTEGGAGFYILGEWINGCEYLLYDTSSDTMMWKSGNSISEN